MSKSADYAIEEGSQRAQHEQTYGHVTGPWEGCNCKLCGSDEIKADISGNPQNDWLCEHCGLEFTAETSLEIIGITTTNCTMVEECQHCKKMGVVHLSEGIRHDPETGEEIHYDLADPCNYCGKTNEDGYRKK